jgi:glycosyltransferase involved in cell wall biosynthesis
MQLRDADLVVSPEVDVVCTSRNASAYIEDFVTRLDRQMSPLGMTWRLIVVDDSDDDTAVKLQSLVDAGRPIRLLHRRCSERAGGYSGALVEGFAVATAPTIAVIDPDMREAPEALERLITAMRDGDADIAIGSRFMGGASAVATDGWLHRQASTVSARVCTVMFREARGVSDPSSGCYAFHRNVISHVVFRPERFRVLIEILVRGSWSRVVEIPVDYVGQLIVGRSLTIGNIALYLSRLVRLWLETRIDPTRLAEKHAVRRDALEAPVPWLDPIDLDSSATAGTRVLMVASEVPPVRSGVANTVDRIGQELTARGMSVTYMSGRDHPRLEFGEVRVSALGAVLALSRTPDTYDVVVLHGPMPTVSEVILAGMALRRRSRRTALVYVHHFDIDFQYLGIPSIAYNIVTHALARTADRVVVTSHSYGAMLSRQRADNVRVIPWAVDPLEMPGPASDYDGQRPLRVLFVGQQRGYKGIANLIHAVAGQDSLQLTVAGGGPLLDEHRALVASLDATNITIAGPVSPEELDELFATHDVVTLPSITRVEAFGVVLLEGMRAGCVPVAADLPGVRDVVGRDGVLVAPRRIATLRDALQDLASDPSDVQRRSKAAMARAAEFTWGTTGDHYAQVITEALHDRS